MPYSTRNIFLVAGGLLLVLIVFFMSASVIINNQNKQQPTVEDNQMKQALLTPPAEEEQLQYEEQVKALAEVADVLTLGQNCAMDPLILKLPSDATLKIKNADTVTHTVSFEDQNFFNVEPGDTRELSIKDTFNKDAGIYRYKCNDLSLEENVGVMYITQ